jgi:hypothetical protein
MLTIKSIFTVVCYALRLFILIKLSTHNPFLKQIENIYNVLKQYQENIFYERNFQNNRITGTRVRQNYTKLNFTNSIKQFGQLIQVKILSVTL